MIRPTWCAAPLPEPKKKDLPWLNPAGAAGWWSAGFVVDGGLRQDGGLQDGGLRQDGGLHRPARTHRHGHLRSRSDSSPERRPRAPPEPP